MTTVRSRMINRTTIERDEGGKNASIGAANVPNWVTIHANQPCYLSMFRVARSGKELVTPDKGVSLTELVLHLPIGLDVTEKDRVNIITDRAGTVILSGVMNIRSVLPHHDHLELKIERAS